VDANQRSAVNVVLDVFFFGIQVGQAFLVAAFDQDGPYFVTNVRKFQV
jgi:hypothetical protein